MSEATHYRNPGGKASRAARRWSRDASKRPPATRILAWLVLAVFCFQLSRFYLVIPLDAFVCEAAESAHDHALPTQDHHHEHDSLAPAGDDGYYFQHCKDTLNGMCLVPLQLLGLTVVLWQQNLEPAWAHFALPHRSALENHLPPPFEPPRA